MSINPAFVFFPPMITNESVTIIRRYYGFYDKGIVSRFVNTSANTASMSFTLTEERHHAVNVTAGVSRRTAELKVGFTNGTRVAWQRTFNGTVSPRHTGTLTLRDWGDCSIYICERFMNNFLLIDSGESFSFKYQNPELTFSEVRN
jgi:hypothetical protein